MNNQRSILREISYSGIGLHTGKECKVTLRPAPADTGIVFYRTDRGIMIKLHPLAVVDTAFATTIGYNGTRIKTIEHLMSAISGLEIDNLYIDVEGPEIPAFDGSSVKIVEILLECGFSHQNAHKKYVEITSPISFSDGSASISAIPFAGRRFTQILEFGNNLLPRQEITLDLSHETFIRDVAPARTFGFLKDVEMLRQNGLAKGGTLENAVVIDGEKILNPSGLRFADEFVRHKVLDCIGDLAVAGLPIKGHIIAERSGHSTNIKFLKHLLSSRNSYIIQGVSSPCEYTSTFA